jgi:aspartyl/glutamyl-tRNA(Asn/Gln) amidotransferase C subunit
MITEKEVRHIAKLARLNLTEKETKKYQKEFSKILDYVGKLKRVNVSKIEPTSYFILVKNIMREDKESEKRKAKTQPRLAELGRNEELLELAPETKNNYLKVKSVL